MSRLFYIVILCVAILCGCNGRQQNAVPRPVAYPRVQLADTFFCKLDSAAALVDMLVNTQAKQIVGRHHTDAFWIDLIYDIYNGAVMHLTIQSLSSAELKGAMANRMQRIEMNVGAGQTQLTELDNGIFEGIVVKAAAADVTPLQFLATDNKSLLVYGSLEMPSGSGDAEMVSPIVNAVENDMIRMVNSLHYPQ